MAQLIRYSSGVEVNGHTHGFCMLQQAAPEFVIKMAPVSTSAITTTYVEVANT
ncbi:MAG: hypothetical protein IT292_02380 [Deltaproteobacteria bacterium]|nr:hypothetical protein [Deltaproteobacteria bacterium]